MELKDNCKYLEVEISKKLYSTINLKVPMDFDSSSLLIASSIKALSRIVKEYEKSTNIWEEDAVSPENLELNNIRTVSREEAIQYDIFDFKI